MNRHVTITWSENEDAESFDESVAATDESCPPMTPMTPVSKAPAPPGILLGKNHANRQVSVTWSEKLESFDKSIAACKKSCPPLRKKLGRRTLRKKAGVAWKGGTLKKVSKNLIYSSFESPSTPTKKKDVAVCKKSCPPLRKKLGRRTLRKKAGVAWKGDTLKKVSKALFSSFESPSTPTIIENKEEEANQTPRRSARIAAQKKKNQPLRRSPRIANMLSPKCSTTRGHHLLYLPRWICSSSASIFLCDQGTTATPPLRTPRTHSCFGTSNCSAATHA